jgi:hypothetical protein
MGIPLIYLGAVPLAYGGGHGHGPYSILSGAYALRRQRAITREFLHPRATWKGGGEVKNKFKVGSMQWSFKKKTKIEGGE